MADDKLTASFIPRIAQLMSLSRISSDSCSSLFKIGKISRMYLSMHFSSKATCLFCGKAVLKAFFADSETSLQGSLRPSHNGVKISLIKLTNLVLNFEKNNPCSLKAESLTDFSESYLTILLNKKIQLGNKSMKTLKSVAFSHKLLILAIDFSFVLEDFLEHFSIRFFNS